MPRLANRTKCEICKKQWALESLLLTQGGRDLEVERCKYCGFTPSIGKGGFLEPAKVGYTFEPLKRTPQENHHASRRQS